MNVFCIKHPSGRLNHATACMTEQDSINEFLDQERTALMIQNEVWKSFGFRKKCTPSWELFEAQGYKCVKCELSEVQSTNSEHSSQEIV
jgi:hypothetical protein